ncbi:hypothetical protein [Bacteroides xylanisolvens]|jgi:hypothetical protein|nr:hypothetical protein [Bacteroides xylanisolvens]CAG9875275.1 hypothetical protein BOVAC2_2198 [Bacteroides ovatus]MBX9093118.1 hypothetical protein [Bacteroides xylanisolvens]MBX9168301.1 hypothetical protein [Bacteroides xylanisolvens]MCU4241561.1 hypothetical protein [Bacteroides xylanisolvens]RGV14973.1 hypothetical protein DWW25_09890 [Bacteroides xylanisolvens]
MLGVYIVRYQGGPTTLYGEDVEWKTVILDLRDDFMNLSKNQDIEEFYPVIASDLGICVGVVRMLPGSRPNDHLVAWLFIPPGTSISGQKLYDKLRKLREIIGESKIDVDKCRKIEDWESDNDTNFLLSKQKSDSKAYFRVETTDFNMIEILDKLYQESYFYYKVVYLLKMKDRSCSFPVNWDMENISEKFVEETKVLRIPQIPDGVKVIIGESTLSTENNNNIGNYRIPSNIDEAEVTRDGFKNILVSGLSDFENDHFFSNLSWEKIIKRDFFIINGSDKNNKEIPSFTLYLNNQQLYSEICLPENELSKVDIAVEANGYKKFKGAVDLKNYSSKSPFVIELTKEEKTYDLVIPYSVKSRKDKIKYPISIENWRECSIEGYRKNECKNEIRFEYDSRYWIRSNGKLIILVLFLVLLLGGGIGTGMEFMIAKNYISEMEKEKSDSICKLNDKILQLEKKQKSVTFVNTDVSANINNTIIDNSAILYLDSNKVWQRGQMNSIKCLEGLWDDLNSRKKTRIMKWNEKLSQSNKWKKIRDNVKINGSTHFRDTTKRQYDIVVEDYIKSFQSKTGATKSTKSEEVQNSAKKRIGQLD